MKRIPTFHELRDNILKCKKCSFKDKKAEPLYFNCNDPKLVKILVITEQPKRRENISTENNIVNFLRYPSAEEKRSKTRKTLLELFKEEFITSITGGEGRYYWTHHTKCASRKREIRNDCPKLWYLKELSIFVNLTLLITFGTKSYEALGLNNSFYECFWSEIESLIKGTFLLDNNDFVVTQNDKEYFHIALPHPSAANPLSHFIPYFSKAITGIINKI